MRPIKQEWLVAWLTSLSIAAAAGQDRPDSARNLSRVIAPGGLPHRVHVFEDYETEIEKRWWLRGVPETNNIPPGLSASVPNRRACRASATKDFDDKMGDPSKTYKAVVFNPVPGPPMGRNTRLSFRYWLKGTDTLRVQIYSLSRGYHRHLTLTNLTRGSWQSAAVDMTEARRPDGSGGPLSEDERIDDIQFYIAPDAELIIDDIVLYDAAPEAETNSFPRRILFTGWFDTGKQGAEWPGDFEIVNHDPPLTWKAARSVLNAQTDQPWIRVHLRGARPLSTLNRLRFRYRLAGGGEFRVILANHESGQELQNVATNLTTGIWAETTMDFKPAQPGAFANEVRFMTGKGAELFVDDLLLFEPSQKPSRTNR